MFLIHHCPGCGEYPSKDEETYTETRFVKKGRIGSGTGYLWHKVCWDNYQRMPLKYPKYYRLSKKELQEEMKIFAAMNFAMNWTRFWSQVAESIERRR